MTRMHFQKRALASFGICTFFQQESVIFLVNEKDADFISKARDDQEGFRDVVGKAKILQKIYSVSLVLLTQNSTRKMNSRVIV